MTLSDLHPLVSLAHTIDLAGDPLAALRAEFERIVTHPYSTIANYAEPEQGRREFEAYTQAVAACLMGEYILFLRLQAAQESPARESRVVVNP